MSNNIIKNFNLVGYVENILNEKSNNGAFKNCPFCNSKNHFSVNMKGEKQLYKSFSNCCKGGDIVNFLEEYNQISKKEAFKEVENMSESEVLQLKRKEPETQESANMDDIKKKEAIKSIIQNYCNENYKMYTSYIQNRGITQDTYLNSCIYYIQGGVKSNLKWTKNYDYIIKISDGHLILRDSTNTQQNKAMNLGSPELYNIHILNNENINELFIVEGYFDMLSLEQIGKSVICLNSTSNSGKLIKALNGRKKELNLILALDSDKPGQNTQNMLVNKLKPQKNINLFELIISNKLNNVKLKDINDLLINSSDLEQFKKYINSNIVAINKDKKDFGIYINEAENCYYAEKELKSGIKIIDVTNYTMNILEIITSESQTIWSIEIHFENRVINRKIDLQAFNSLKEYNNALNCSELYTAQKIDLQALKQCIVNNSNYKTITLLNKHGIYDNKLIQNQGITDLEGNELGNYITYEQNKMITNFDLNNKLTSQDIDRLNKYLFNYNSIEVCSVIASYAVVALLRHKLYKSKIKLPFLFITGESGSGKSATVENILNNIVNCTSSDLKATDTPFSILKSANSNNLCLLIINEYKNDITSYKKNFLEDFLKNAYDYTASSRGNKQMNTDIYEPLSPIIVLGEQGTADKAVKERSVNLYLKGNDQKNDFYRIDSQALNRLGNSILDSIFKIEKNEIIKGIEAIEKQLKEKNIHLENRPLLNLAIILWGLNLLKNIGLNAPPSIQNLTIRMFVEVSKENYSNSDLILEEIKDIVISHENDFLNPVKTEDNIISIGSNFLAEELNRRCKNKNYGFYDYNSIIKDLEQREIIINKNVSQRYKRLNNKVVKSILIKKEKINL